MIGLGIPHDPAWRVIAFCWTVFAVVWMVSALFAKRTVERSVRFGWVLTILIVYWVLRGTGGLRHTLWSPTAAIGVLADLLTVAGLAIALWARATLGRNWSGQVAFKEEHELIQHGPYAYVRHPIYTGLLLMILGTAVESGTLVGFVILAAAAVTYTIKAQLEERLMISHFPEAYEQYRHRTKALIPGVW